MVVAVPLVFVLIAFAGMLIWQGTQPFVGWLENVIESTDIPFAGRLAHGIASLTDGVVRGLLDWLDGAIGNIASFITGPVYVIETLVAKVFDNIAAVANSVQHVIASVVPRALGQAYAYAHTLAVDLAGEVSATVTSVEHWTQSLVTAAISTAEAYAYALAGQLVADVRTVTTWASAEFGRLAAVIAAGITAAETYAHTLAVDVVNGTNAALTELETQTTALVGTLAGTVATDVAVLDTKITAAISTAIDGTIGILATDIEHVTAATIVDLDHAIDAAIGVAATDFPDVMAWVKGIDLTKVVDIAGVTTLSIAGIGALTRYLEECGIPNCRNLGRFGNLLNELGNLLEDGAIMALIAAMVADPVGTAREVDSVLGPVASDAISAGRALIGV